MPTADASTDSQVTGCTARSRVLSFEAARAIVRNLKLNSTTAWREWCTSGQRPGNVPADPTTVYCDAGWVSMQDWLGYLPFEAARAIVHDLKLNSGKEWKEWCKSGQRPANIPFRPSTAYRDAGWVSMQDWLGYTCTHARSLVIRLGSAGRSKRKRAVPAPWSAQEPASLSMPAPSSLDPAAWQTASRSIDQPAAMGAAVDSIDGSVKKARWSEVREMEKPSLWMFIRWDTSVGVNPSGYIRWGTSVGAHSLGHIRWGMSVGAHSLGNIRCGWT